MAVILAYKNTMCELFTIHVMLIKSGLGNEFCRLHWWFETQLKESFVRKLCLQKSLIITFVQIQKWGKFHWTVVKKNAILAFKSLCEWSSHHIVLNKFLPNCLGFLEETLIFQILFKYFYFNEISLFWLDEQLQ